MSRPRRSNRIFEFETHVGQSGLEVIREDWETVYSSLPQKRFYTRIEWYQAGLRVYEPLGHTILFFLARRDGRPVAIFPLKENRLQGPGVSWKILETGSNVHVYFADFVYDPETCGPTILEEFWAYLQQQMRGRFDAVMMRFLRPGATVLHDQSRLPGWPFVKIGEQSSVFPASGGYADLTEKFSPELRTNLRRGRKRLQSLGEETYGYATNAEDMLQDLEDFIAVEGSGWKGQAGTGSAICCDENMHRFYRELVRLLADKGGCRVHLLKAGTTVLAGDFSLLDDRTMYCVKIGFNEEFARLSPGTVLLDNMLRETFGDERLAWADWVTHLAWHKNWSPQVYAQTDIILWRASFKGALGYGIHQGKKMLKPLVLRARKILGR